MIVTTYSIPYPEGFLIQSLKATATGSPCSPKFLYLGQQLRDRRIPPPQKHGLIHGRQAGINGIDLSPPFPTEQKREEEQSMGDLRKASRDLSPPQPPVGSSTCWDWEPLAPPQIPPRDLQPSLPYELAGQVFHKMIDLIPVMQDTSWSRDTMITGHISLSFPSHMFCHTLLSEAFTSFCPTLTAHTLPLKRDQTVLDISHLTLKSKNNSHPMQVFEATLGSSLWQLGWTLTLP